MVAEELLLHGVELTNGIVSPLVLPQHCHFMEELINIASALVCRDCALAKLLDKVFVIRAPIEGSLDTEHRYGIAEMSLDTPFQIVFGTISPSINGVNTSIALYSATVAVSQSLYEFLVRCYKIIPRLNDVLVI